MQICASLQSPRSHDYSLDTSSEVRLFQLLKNGHSSTSRRKENRPGNSPETVRERHGATATKRAKIMTYGHDAESPVSTLLDDRVYKLMLRWLWMGAELDMSDEARVTAI